MTLTLDRIALEDVGAEPQRLAEAILAQMQYRSGRVPITEIARALGITEIRKEPLTNLEGCLITTPERYSGSILVNSNSSRRRRNFTLGHELGHFLNAYHVGVDDKLSCSSADMRSLSSTAGNRHSRHEAEANRFAIELLAPRIRCKALMRSDPDIAEILAMVKEFDISPQAAARHYVELHDEPLCVVFSKERRVTYSIRSQACPVLSVRKGNVMPLPPAPAGTQRLTSMAYVDTTFWLEHFDGELMQQTLFQAKGYAVSLLRLIPNEEDELDIEDSYDRFVRLNDRK